MAAVTITPAHISASWDRGSVILNFVSGVALTIGQAVYLDDNNQAQKAIATSSAASRAIGIVVGVTNFYAETTGVAGQWVAVAVRGPVFGFTGLVDGQPLWVSKDTAGGLDTAAPTTAYDWIVGNGVGSDTFYVDPGQTTPVSA